MRNANENVSRVIFGTSQICRLVSNRNIQKVLHCAYDCGVRHFDTARMYGFGEAESKIRSFLKGRRDICEVSTKFGLKFNEPGYFKRKIFLLGRLFKSFFPIAARSTIQTVAPKQYLDFSVDSTRKSVETSLRELGVESIDYLFFHEPIMGSDIDQSIFLFLDDLVRSGKVKNYGMSGSLTEINSMEKYLGVFVYNKQFSSNIIKDCKIANNANNFCFNVIGSVLGAPGVKEKLMSKKIDKNKLVAALLMDRLINAGFNKVLFNSNRIDTINKVIGIVDNFKMQDCHLIKEVLNY